MIKMKCPNCGQSLQIEDGRASTYCPYCGKQIVINNKQKENTILVSDEVKAGTMDTADRQKPVVKNGQKKKKGGKFIIFLMVLAFIGAFIAFLGKEDVLAGILTIVQIALLVLALLICNGAIEKIKGVHVPYVVPLILSVLLAIPYFSTIRSNPVRQNKEKLVWPTTELAQRLPKPDAKYGDVIQNSDYILYVDVDDYDDQKYEKYIDACKEAGFTIDASTQSYSYEAADQDGYVLTLRHYTDSMNISLATPHKYKTFTWPVSDLASLLPAPPVNRGEIELDTADSLRVYIPDMDEDAISNYAQAVLNAGFNIDYSNSDGYFNGSNANGVQVELTHQTGYVMEIDVVKPKPADNSTSNEQEQSSSEPTKQDETSQQDNSSGLDPDFKAAMDSYEAFFDSYCEFLKSYDSSDLTMLGKYTEMMSQYADTMSKLDAIDESKLTPEEDAYYLEVYGRIMQKLAETTEAVGQ